MFYIYIYIYICLWTFYEHYMYVSHIRIWLWYSNSSNYVPKLNRDACDTMRSNSFPFVLAPLSRSLCLFWRKTHTKDRGRNLLRDWKWRREGRSERRQREELTNEGRARQLTREGRARQLTREGRARQLTKQGRGGRSAWDSSPEEGRLAEGGSEKRHSKMN